LRQGEQASVHHLFEKHLQADYTLGFERFWRCALRVAGIRQTLP